MEEVGAARRAFSVLPKFEAIMSNAAPGRAERASASAALRSRLIDHLALGMPIEAIARREGLRPRVVETLVQKEFDAIEIRRLDQFAKLQIKRLNAMIARLNDGSGEPDVRAMALSLRAFDRMDRYHSLGRGAAIYSPPDETARQRLADKLNRMAERHAAPVLPSR